jgi:hypothetical protein
MLTSKPTSEFHPCGRMEGIVMALQKRGKFYHYHFWVNGRRFRGSTKKTTITAARRTEALVMARAEEKGHLALVRRCPLLREFSRRFFEWVDNQSTLKEKSRVYYSNGLAAFGEDGGGRYAA